VYIIWLLKVLTKSIMKKTVSILLVILLAAVTWSVSAQEISIIPAPAQLKKGQGVLTLSNSTNIMVPARQIEVGNIAKYLVSKLKPASGYTFNIVETGEAGIQLMLNDKPDAKLGKEGYTLEITSSRAVIKGNSAAGIFYGVQSLLQLLPREIESEKVANGVSWTIPVVSIIDYPRFAWRGIMLDVSRHYFDKDYIKEYIDQLARYKFNRFHWHLTDDNGWRVEIKSYPKLTEVGAWRVPRTGTFGSNTAPRQGEKPTYGGFYTQQDIREVVQYAKERYIEILPEIDVPGHSMAAIAAYPELCVTKDSSIQVNPGSNFSKWFGHGKFEMYVDNALNPTDENVYKFLYKVFGEIASLFPFEYIHMGGDECYKGYWERDPEIQAFMKKNNIKNGEELQSYFSKRVTKIITDKKKKVIGWDEILEGGLAPGAAVMSWRGIKGGIEAAHLKHPVVMSPSPMYYLDMVQGDPSIEAPVYSTARLKDTYTFDPLPPEIDSAYVLGGQGNLWTEQVPSTQQVEYMTYPRAFALSETLWSPKSLKDWNGFVARVEDHFERFEAAKINYSPAIYDPIISVKKNQDNNISIELSTEAEGLDIHYSVDNTVPNQYSPVYKERINFPEDADMLKVITYRNGKPVGRLITLKTEDIVKRIRK
jgi:hexosaminidase